MAAIKMKLTTSELAQLENLLERAIDHKQIILFAGEAVIEELELELDRDDKEVRQQFGKDKVYLFAPGIDVEVEEDDGEDDPDADYDEDEEEQREDA